MKASIVVPTFNQGEYIRDCLLSIQSQSFQNFEVIIQDSLSTDQTEQICRDFCSQDSRFQYFREKDTGQSDAINRGLARCTGEVWTWLCSDDYYADPSALEKLLDRLCDAAQESQDVVGVFGDAQYVTEKGEIVGPYHNSTCDLSRRDFKLNWPLAQPSSFFFRRFVNEVGGVDASLHLGMDLDLFLKILTDNRQVVYSPQLTVNIRLQPNSKSVKFRKKTAENALNIVRRHFKDPGSPFESAYAKEYAISQRLELWERVRNSLWVFIPYHKTIRARWKHFENHALGYAGANVWERRIQPLRHRIMYKAYLASIFQLKCKINSLIEVVLRAKGFLISLHVACEFLVSNGFSFVCVPSRG